MSLFNKFVFLLLMSVTAVSQAGIYTDDLSRCLVESSSEKDKLVFVKWMFTAISLHPAVSDIANVDGKERDKSNQEMANLMVVLVSDRCLAQSKKAIKYEGAVALQSSFEVFGKIAAQELFANPAVAEGLAELDKFVDADTLNRRLGIAR